MPVQVILPRNRIDITGLPNRIKNWHRGTAIAFANRMSAYPPAKVGSRYRRTRRYRNGWKRAGFSPTIRLDSVVVVNNVPYARRVGGRRTGPFQQAEMHAQTGWQSVSDVAPQVIRDRAAALQQAILPFR